MFREFKAMSDVSLKKHLISCLKSYTLTIFLIFWPFYLTFTKIIISILNEWICDGHLKKMLQNDFAATILTKRIGSLHWAQHSEYYKFSILKLVEIEKGLFLLFLKIITLFDQHLLLIYYKIISKKISSRVQINWSWFCY